MCDQAQAVRAASKSAESAITMSTVLDANRQFGCFPSLSEQCRHARAFSQRTRQARAVI